MHTKIVLIVLSLTLALPLSGHAEQEEIVAFNLSLAGYRLGMSYDEASAVRPFHHVSDLTLRTGSNPFYEAVIDQVYVDDVEMQITLSFVDDKVQKVVCKFHPLETDRMLTLFLNTLGRSENKSRLVSLVSGIDSHQTVHKWNYPTALVILFGASNSNFSLVSLVDTEAKHRTRQSKNAEQPTLTPQS